MGVEAQVAKASSKGGRSSGCRAGTYVVGYGRPPKETRFEKGKSGNPGGKRKGTAMRSVEDLFHTALFSPVQVTENGKMRLVPGLEVAFMALIRRAAQGDPKALREIDRLLQRYPLKGDGDVAGEPVDYREVLRRKLEDMAARIQQERPAALCADADDKEPSDKESG